MISQQKLSATFLKKAFYNIRLNKWLIFALKILAKLHFFLIFSPLCFHIHTLVSLLPSPIIEKAMVERTTLNNKMICILLRTISAWSLKLIAWINPTSKEIWNEITYQRIEKKSKASEWWRRHSSEKKGLRSTKYCKMRNEKNYMSL